MGQQQLLLLVLGILIVGIATVVGISAFNDGRRKAAGDELVSVGARVAAEGAAWVLRPSSFGGGGGSPVGITFEKIGYAPGVTYVAGSSTFTVASDATSFTISGTETTNGMYLVSRVFGATAGCVVTVSQSGSVPTTPTLPAGCSGW